MQLKPITFTSFLFIIIFWCNQPEGYYKYAFAQSTTSNILDITPNSTDSVSPYPFPKLRYFPEMPINTDNPVTVEGAELGRFLFYDPILSLDSSFSCSSCHLQKFAFADGPKRFSTGINGAKTIRNTMPLFNLAWYPSMFWDGKASSIEEQVFHPVSAINEMNLAWSVAVDRIQNSAFYRPLFEKAFGNTVVIDSTIITKAIGQFERTLLSYNSKYDRALRGETYLSKDEYEGFVLLNDQSMADCLHCHNTDANALGTSTEFGNNGISPIFETKQYVDIGKGGITGKEKDYGLFKIPSLRNVAVTAPYMHDGRFETLEEVLDFYSEGVNLSANIDSKMTRAHEGGVKLTADEKRKIILFLGTLTDSVFLTNPAFSNPF